MEQTTNTAGGVVLTLEAAKAFNYALHQNRIPLVRLAETAHRSGAPPRDGALSLAPSAPNRPPAAPASSPPTALATAKRCGCARRTCRPTINTWPG